MRALEITIIGIALFSASGAWGESWPERFEYLELDGSIQLSKQSKEGFEFTLSTATSGGRYFCQVDGRAKFSGDNLALFSAPDCNLTFERQENSLNISGACSSYCGNGGMLEGRYGVKPDDCRKNLVEFQKKTKKSVQNEKLSLCAPFFNRPERQKAYEQLALAALENGRPLACFGFTHNLDADANAKPGSAKESLRVRCSEEIWGGLAEPKIPSQMFPFCRGSILHGKSQISLYLSKCFQEKKLSKQSKFYLDGVEHPINNFDLKAQKVAEIPIPKGQKYVPENWWYVPEGISVQLIGTVSAAETTMLPEIMQQQFLPKKYVRPESVVFMSNKEMVGANLETYCKCSRAISSKPRDRWSSASCDDYDLDYSCEYLYLRQKSHWRLIQSKLPQ